MVLSLEYYKNLGCRDSALVNKKKRNDGALCYQVLKF